MLIILGILSAGLGFKSFFGSETILSMAGLQVYPCCWRKPLILPLSVVIFIVNIPFLYLAYRRLGLYFAVRSALAWP